MKNNLLLTYFYNLHAILLKRAQRLIELRKFINEFQKTAHFKQATNNWLHAYNRYWVIFRGQFFNSIQNYAQSIARYIGQICEVKNDVLHPLFQRSLKQRIQFQQRWLAHVARWLNYKSAISAKGMDTHTKKVKN